MRTQLRPRLVGIWLAGLLAMALLVGTALPQSAYALGPNAMRSFSGLTAMFANDESSTGSQSMGFSVNFFGNTYT